MKTRAKIILVIIIIIIIILIIIAGFFFLNRIITGNVIQEQQNSSNNLHMYTKALCNDSNYCQDNEITCQGNQTVSVSPITGAVIQHEKDWQDPRNESDKDKLC